MVAFSVSIKPSKDDVVDALGALSVTLAMAMGTTGLFYDKASRFGPNMLGRMTVFFVEVSDASQCFF